MRKLHALTLGPLCAWLLGPACISPDEIVLSETRPSWMEWPREVRAGEPFSIRVFTYPGCGTVRPLRIDVQHSDSAITLQAFRIMRFKDFGAHEPCQTFVNDVDTLVPIWGIGGHDDRVYSINILSQDFDSTGALLHQVQSIGTILVRAVTPIDSNGIVGGGWVQGYANEAGCPLIFVPNKGPTLVDNAPPLPWSGFIFGHEIPSPNPSCGRAQAFHIDRFTLDSIRSN